MAFPTFEYMILVVAFEYMILVSFEYMILVVAFEYVTFYFKGIENIEHI